MRHDPLLRAQLDYCAPRGIPHSEFLSWHIDDQAKALGWSAEQRSACHHCGTSEWEWEVDRFAYEAKPYVCLGCMHLEQAREQSSKGLRIAGQTIRLVRNGGSDAGTH